MKSKRTILSLLFLLMAALALTNCGGNSPQALARETVELTKQLLAGTGNRTQIESRIKEIETQFDKMSAANKLIYSAEFARLSAENAGGFLDSFMKNDEVQGALKSIEESVNAPEFQDSMKALNDAASGTATTTSGFEDSFKSFSESLNETFGSSEVQDALKALESFGAGFGR